MPDLSIIIVTYNGKDLLKNCIESIYKTKGKLKFEIIVVDNGSTDGSEEIKKVFPSMIYLRSNKNLGFSKAANIGVRYANGRYICLLNNDTIVIEGSLGELIKFLDANPQCAIAGPWLVNQDGTRQNSFDNFPVLETFFFNKSLLRLFFPKRYPSKYQQFQDPTEVESFVGACLVVRRNLINFDEDYFFFFEETDLCLRVRKKGFKVYLVPSASVIHLKGATKKLHASRAKVEYVRSLFTYFKKNRTIAEYLILKAFYPLKVFVNTLFSLSGLIFTFGLLKSLRQKLSINLHLFLWFLLLCPDSFGLKNRDRHNGVNLSMRDLLKHLQNVFLH